MASEYLTFIKELRTGFDSIGSVIPSSPALARAMVRPIIESSKESLSILEVGPGTGPFTRKILKLMGPNDRLVICEINKRFIDQLKRELPKNRDFLFNQDRVEFFLGPIQELARRDGEKKFDVIVSSLPFSNFPPQLVDEILGLLQGMLAPDGALTFCEYVGLRKLSRLIPERRDQAREIDRVIDHWCSKVERRGKVRKEVAILNIPPAFSIQFDYSPSVGRKISLGKKLLSRLDGTKSKRSRRSARGVGKGKRLNGSGLHL